MTGDLLSLNEAVSLGITRLRLPHWRGGRDYIRIEITASGELGPRFQLYSPALARLVGQNPTVWDWAATEIDPDRRQYVPHRGNERGGGENPPG